MATSGRARTSLGAPQGPGGYQHLPLVTGTTWDAGLQHPIGEAMDQLARDLYGEPE